MTPPFMLLTVDGEYISLSFHLFCGCCVNTLTMVFSILCFERDMLTQRLSSLFQLTPGGKAEVTGVNVGDWLLQIDGESTTSMTHIEAQNKIRACSNKLPLVLSR